MTSAKANNCQKLLIEFRSKDSLTYKDIQELLACNRQNAHNYISTLKDMGYTFKTTIKNRQTCLSLQKCDDKTEPFIPLSKSVLIKYLILNSIELIHNSMMEATTEKIIHEMGLSYPNEQKSSNDIEEEFFEDSECDSESINENVFYKENYLNISLPTLYRYIKELVMDNELIETQCTIVDPHSLNHKIVKKYTLTYLNYQPMIYESATNNVLETFQQYYDCLPKDFPYYEELSSINRKFSLVTTDISDQEHFISYGRRRLSFKTRQEFLSLLNQYDYRRKILKITYRSASGQITIKKYAIGLIVYSDEKDRLYLYTKLCSKDGVLSSIYHTLSCDNIEKIEETLYTHAFYRSSEVLNMFRNTTGISYKKPSKVVVKFDGLYNQQQQLENFKLVNSTNTTIIPKEDGFILTTTISNIEDIAGYLRTFGTHCQVIEPKELKEFMITSAKRSLTRYEESI